MDADIKLDGSVVRLEGDRVAVTAPDLEVNSPARRTGAGHSTLRRALVHDGRDGLTINFGGDYPGGVFIAGNVELNAGLRSHGNCTMPGLILLEYLIMHRPNTDDLFLNAGFFQSLTDFLNGEPIVDTIQLDNFEPDPAMTPIGGPVAMKPVDLAAELHRLRAEIKSLKDRLHALDGK